MSKLTEQAIKTAFIELLREKPLSKITIKELTDRCGINRNTFYYHYKDISDLVESLMVEQTDQILTQHPNVDSFEECLYAISDFIEENRTIVYHIYRSLSRIVFEKYLWKLCHRFIDNYWLTSPEARSLNPTDQALIKKFIVCAFFGMAMDWIANGMTSDSSRQDIHRLFELLSDTKNTDISIQMPKN